MIFLFLPFLLLLSPASPQHTPTPASAHLSSSYSRLYMFLPSPQSPDLRFVSLNMSQRVLFASNMSNGFRELPSPPKDLMTPLLFSDTVVVLAGSCESDIALHEYNLSSSTWRKRELASGVGASARGRNHGGGFGLEVSQTSSAVAPANTFMSAAPKDRELHEYEQGSVLQREVQRRGYFFGGTCGAGGAAAETYSEDLLQFDFPPTRDVTYVPGKRKGVGEGGSSSAVDVRRFPGDGDNGGVAWPIPEAGFSLTSLRDRQSLSVVMVGGHTARAFVDMRQVAVYLVPEARWRFANVSLPRSTPPRLPVSSTRVGNANAPEPTAGGSSTREDLSAIVERRDEEVFSRRIDSRAGHSAVVTGDGKRVVVYGGWVGDVSTPAEPRLIVLDMSGESGRGGWRWEAPYTFGGELGPPGDGHREGLAGHAAVMLDGDVMMITSGYKISSYEDGNGKGRAPQVSDATYLFNVSSNTWTSRYTPPQTSALSIAGEGGGKGKCKDSKTATVVGALLGVIAAIAAAALFFWYRRKKMQDADEEDPMSGNTWETEGRRTFGFYSKEGSVRDRVGIIEKTHISRVLGMNHSSPSLTRSRTPDSHSSTTNTITPPRASPSRQAQVYSAVAPRVSTILETDEESTRRHSASSAGATDGSIDLAEMYTRTLAFAEKMAQQETIYERAHESSGTPTTASSSSDVSVSAPSVAPAHPRLVAATLSNENLNTLPRAPLRIPSTQSYPPCTTLTRTRTLMKPARFFPSTSTPPPSPRPSIDIRSVSLDTHPTSTSTSPPSPSNAQPTPQRGIKRWLSVSAVRNALPQINPSSPMSIFGSASFRSVSSSASFGRRELLPEDEHEDEDGDGDGEDVEGRGRSVSVPIMLDRGDEWDVEDVIGSRVVQVMFTAPKGALRVVNYDEPVSS